MNIIEYEWIVESARRLPRSLFDMSSPKKIDALEAVLDGLSANMGETVIGIPLVRPYGGPAGEYIALPEKLYYKMRAAMESGEVKGVHQQIGVPYDKRRFEINRKQLMEKFTPPASYNDFIRTIIERGGKVKAYR